MTISTGLKESKNITDGLITPAIRQMIGQICHHFMADDQASDEPNAASSKMAA